MHSLFKDFRGTVLCTDEEGNAWVEHVTCNELIYRFPSDLAYGEDGLANQLETAHAMILAHKETHH